MKFLTRYGAVLVLIPALVLSARADTLETKDRRVVNGKYLGGTQSNVRFLVDGRVELYLVEEIVALTFGGETSPTKKPAAAVHSSAGRTSHARSSTLSQSVTVPAGTRLLVRMVDSVDSEKNKLGDRFHASLEEDLTVKDLVVARKGTDVYGSLVEAEETGHGAGKSELKLELTDMMINQRRQPIVTGDYQVFGKSRGANTAKKMGGGAAVGAGVGAGAGTAVQVLARGEQLRVPSETLLEFRIEQPFYVELSQLPAR